MIPRTLTQAWYDMVMSYYEFCRHHRTYDGHCKCFVSGCNKPGLYEGGDDRYRGGMCAEHADMPGAYRDYLRGIIARAQAFLGDHCRQFNVSTIKQVIEPCRSKSLDTINVHQDGTIELVYTDGYIDRD